MCKIHYDLDHNIICEVKLEMRMRNGKLLYSRSLMNNLIISIHFYRNMLDLISSYSSNVKKSLIKNSDI